MLLAGSGLPAAWQGQPLHVVADTGFDSGLNFLRLWRTWRDDPTRCSRLHYAAVAQQAPSRAGLRQAAGACHGLPDLAAELAAEWPGALPPGFHVLHLDDGRVTLTLCIGELLPVLQSWRFLADTVLLAENSTTHDVLRAVARLSHQHTRLVCASTPQGLPESLTDMGFAVTSPPQSGPLAARYAPRWSAPPVPERAPGHATVLGAGLAGAAMCQALGRRGWSITLIDQADGPAQGASGLPVGLMAPHQTAEPTAMSRLTEAGARWMKRELARVLPDSPSWRAGVMRMGGTQAPEWLPDAMQVTPASLVRAWLDETQRAGRLTTTWNSRVSSLQRAPEYWILHDDAGHPTCEASTLILASAWGSQTLLQPWGGDALALSPVRGQLSLGLASDLTEAPPHPLNGAGVFVPRCHWQGNDHWAMGATYERGECTAEVSQTNHRANLAALQGWLPAVADQLTPSFQAGGVSGWAQIRCATGDRLPLAGALPDTGTLQNHRPVHQQPRLPGLYALTGLGSRGLTLALLCAEVLAARMAQEPLQVPADLADALDPARFALRQRRRSS